MRRFVTTAWDDQLSTISFSRLFNNHYYWTIEYPQAGETQDCGVPRNVTIRCVIRVGFHWERKDRRIECALNALTASGWFFRRHR